MAVCEATVLDLLSVEADLFQSHANAGRAATVRSMATANRRVILRSPSCMTPATDALTEPGRFGFLKHHAKHLANASCLSR